MKGIQPICQHCGKDIREVSSTLDLWEHVRIATTPDEKDMLGVCLEKDNKTKRVAPDGYFIIATPIDFDKKTMKDGTAINPAYAWILIVMACIIVIPYIDLDNIVLEGILRTLWVCFCFSLVALVYYVFPLDEDEWNSLKLADLWIREDKDRFLSMWKKLPEKRKRRTETLLLTWFNKSGKIISNHTKQYRGELIEKEG